MLPIDQTGLIVRLPVSSKLLCLTVENGAYKACNTGRVGSPAAVAIWKGLPLEDRYIMPLHQGGMRLSSLKAQAGLNCRLNGC